MPYARRWKWIQHVTQENTQRAAAAAMGVNQSTLSRWLKSGMPTPVLIEMMLKFQCDPVESFVVWGYLKETDVTRLNFEAIARYLPVDVMAREVARRAEVYVESRPETERKTSVGMLRRA